jgi:hypothetical protein
VNTKALSIPAAAKAVGGCAELGDRHRLALRDKRAHRGGEAVGDLGRTVVVE